MNSDFGHTVLVTGFGPFSRHQTNASWEAVKELEKICADSEELRDVRVLVKEVPVSYKDVTEDVPKLWKDLNPSIVLHVGVSYKAECLTLEQHAHSTGYEIPDIHNECPDESDTTQSAIKTDVDIIKICETVNENTTETGCKACISDDAGRYLCEYIYYKSLCFGPGKTLFVHVPDFHQYSTAQTAKGLYKILCHMIKDCVKSQ